MNRKVINMALAAVGAASAWMLIYGAVGGDARLAAAGGAVLAALALSLILGR